MDDLLKLNERATDTSEELGSSEDESSAKSGNNLSKSQKWTKEEDVSLKFLVEQHGMYKLFLKSIKTCIFSTIHLFTCTL